MHQQDYLLSLLLARHAEEIRQADRHRLGLRSHAPRPHPIRQAIGRSLIEFGERLATEPPAKPARSA